MVSRWEREDRQHRRLAIAGAILLYGLVAATSVASISLSLIYGVEAGYLTWLAYEIGRESCKIVPIL